MPRCVPVGLVLAYIVLDGTYPKRGIGPRFSPHVMSVVAKPLDGLRCHLVVQR